MVHPLKFEGTSTFRFHDVVHNVAHNVAMNVVHTRRALRGKTWRTTLHKVVQYVAHIVACNVVHNMAYNAVNMAC